MDQPPAPRLIDARALLLAFTSLGDNCEFGLVQRRGGAEPLGLLRFAFAHTANLIEAILDDLADLDPPQPLRLEQPWNDEYISCFGRHGFFTHTLVHGSDADVAALLAQEARRVPFLRRRLLEDMAAAETIFVAKSDFSKPDEPARLHQALRRHGPNTLLWVALADADNPAGSIQWDQPGLLRGYVERFAPYGDATAIAFEPWLRLCTGALALCGRAPPLLAAPPPQAGVPLGWDGVACDRSDDVPRLHPGATVFRHRVGAAGQGIAALLTQADRLQPGATVAASLWLWLPCALAGRSITPVLTHTVPAQTLHAVLADRGCWQRVWVSAVVPDGPQVDFAVLIDLEPGDMFYSTAWRVEPGPSPGGYWLAEGKA